MFGVAPFEATNANAALRTASLWRYLLLVALVVATGPSVRASLIGSTVTGSLNIYPFDFDGCQNPYTFILEINSGFCAIDAAYDSFSTYFTSTGFTFNENAQSIPFPSEIVLTLTDTAFTGASVTETPNPYPPSAFAGLTYGIAGDVITVNIPGQPFWANPELVAYFNLSPGTAVPEPGFLVLLSIVMGTGAMGLLARNKRLRNGTRVPTARST